MNSRAVVIDELHAIRLCILLFKYTDIVDYVQVNASEDDTIADLHPFTMTH